MTKSWNINHIPITGYTDIPTIHKNGQRFYKVSDTKLYPSITTVLGHGEKLWLNDWRESLGQQKADNEMKRASDRGTAVHLMLEKQIKNDPNPTQNQHIDNIAEFNSLRFEIRKVDNVLLQEAALYSDTLKVAGRVDCVGEYNGVLSIIDFKTSTRNKNQNMILDYFLQTTAYALMVGEMYDITIDDVIILMSVERGLPMVFREKVDNYIEPLLKRVHTFHKGR